MDERALVQDEWPLWCRCNPNRPAISFCTKCHSATCKDCYIRQPDGRALCQLCASEDVQHARPQEIFDSPDLMAFFSLVKHALLRPGEVVKNLNPMGPVGPAIKVGFIASLLGGLMTWVWLTMFPEGAALIDANVQFVLEQLAAYQLTKEAALLFLLGLQLPVSILTHFAVCALLLQVGVRLSNGGQQFSYGAYVRIFCYASVGRLFLLIPAIGPIASVWYILMFCWHAISYYHRLDTTRTFMAIVPVTLGVILLDPAYPPIMPTS